MNRDVNLTGLRPSTFLLAALSLSIGWGIRGNFGHEYGAMIPGALTAIVVCLLSGRADWRERVAYFGMFGALGWGFGGSISYMQVIGYTHSGHLPSQVYGFLCLFVIGFLWGGMGGAGTAFPAVAPKDRLTEVFRPLCWIIIAWILQWRFEDFLDGWHTHFDATWKRQQDPLYWLDADWFSAAVALATMCLFDLKQRRGRGFLSLLALVLAGALTGWLAQGLLVLTHLSKVVAYLFVWPQLHLPTLAAQPGADVNEILANALYNWPNFLMAHPGWAGPLFGVIVGAILYFRKWGTFASGASLFVYMSAGWLIAFLAMPVLLGFGGAGLRMTPPRGDDWAGIVGVYLGTMLWLRRNGMLPVVYAAFVCGIVGGVGFAGAAWLKLWLIAYGNPEIPSEVAHVAAWKHWQQANWHSFLEQTYGFINGLGVALAMGLLARRTAAAQPGHVPRPWTEAFAVAWVLFGVGWINIQKCIPELIEGKMLPETMQAPLFDSIVLSSNAWFAIAFWLCAGCIFLLMRRHQRGDVALVPENSVGRAQLLYLVFLWLMVIMNIVHALPHFSDARLLTEWTITFNAIVCTWLVLTLPRRLEAALPRMGLINYENSFASARRGLVFALVLVGIVMPWSIRRHYEGAFAGHAGKGYRFGPEAAWKTGPILKGQKHK